MSMQLSKEFLWGGATADFQFEGGYDEGGRGLSTHDFETDGNQEDPRGITYRRTGLPSTRSTPAPFPAWAT